MTNTDLWVITSLKAFQAQPHRSDARAVTGPDRFVVRVIFIADILPFLDLRCAPKNFEKMRLTKSCVGA
jgi:hypothetical protein